MQIIAKTKRKQGKRQRNGKANGRQKHEDMNEKMIHDSENDQVLLNGQNNHQQSKGITNGKGEIDIEYKIIVYICVHKRKK